MLKFRQMFGRKTLREDAVAGLVLGVESVPDGLAGGLLAGVNPVYGLYAYMTGTLSGALFTSSSFMAVQATGAMAIVVADVSAVHSSDRTLAARTENIGHPMLRPTNTKKWQTPSVRGVT